LVVASPSLPLGRSRRRYGINKATIKERNVWVDILIRMANHAPVILVAGNHGAELEGDLYVSGRAKGKHPIYLCTEPEFIELGGGCCRGLPIFPESYDDW
jgi:hypothetical protein